MVDFHTHILPGIDDGSRDVDMSMAMLREEQSKGIHTIIATPHFYANRRSINQFLERRQHAFEKLQTALENKGMSPTSLDGIDGKSRLPQILTGAEVYYFAGMGRADQLPQLCIEGTDTIMIEMPFDQWREDQFRDLETIIEKQHLTVVLAHIERYPEFQKNKTIWNRVFAELPVTPQINTGSFLKKGGLFSRDKKKKFVLNWMKEHPDTILGSDAHNPDTRRPNLADGRNIIQKELGEEALRRSDEAARTLVNIHA